MRASTHPARVLLERLRPSKGRSGGLLDRPLVSSPRPYEQAGSEHQEAEADVQGGEESGRKIVEDQAPDEPAYEGDVLLAPLTGRHAEPVFPFRQRTGDPEDRLAGYIEDETQVGEPEGRVSDPSPLENGSRQYSQLPRHAEGDDAEVEGDDRVGEEGCHAGDYTTACEFIARRRRCGDHQVGADRLRPSSSYGSKQA